MIADGGLVYRPWHMRQSTTPPGRKLRAGWNGFDFKAIPLLVSKNKERRHEN
jgi:hypothetical protein